MSTEVGPVASGGLARTRGGWLRLALAIALLAGISLYFWSQSRIPALNEKALMSGSIVLEDPLSFEAKYPIDAADPMWRRIAMTTVNWVWTNRIGMTFGVCFGAAFLTLLRHLPRRSFRSGFANALLGFFTGAPLGVCVNCAAPIARSLYAGGVRIESALAAMLASPTFNFIVVTMVLSLFPLYLAVIKLALTLLVITVAVPLIARLVPKEEIELDAASLAAFRIPAPGSAAAVEAPVSAALGFAVEYVRDLWFVVRTTVPWMLFAGFLGAVVATLIPIEGLQHHEMSLPLLFGAALLGTFLPVPMAFDVILSAALLAAGVPIAFVMTLLFTLGIFSVYSYAIIASSMSRRAALYLAGVIVVVGVGAGRLAEAVQAWQLARTETLLRVGAEPETEAPALAPRVAVMVPGAGSVAPALPRARGSVERAVISVSRMPFRPRSAPGPTLFSRIEARHRGVDRPNLFSIEDMKFPFVQAPGSVSAADVDRDGDSDLVIADNHRGVDLFMNDGRGHFERKGLDGPPLAGVPVIVAAPVDLNGDEWLDLFITTYQAGTYILWNDHRGFRTGDLVRVPDREDAIMANAVGFGDIDKDGDLDVALGHYTGLAVYFARDARDTNRVLFNDGGRLGARFWDAQGVPGETLTLLLSDFDQDGDLDFIEGNDFEEPDAFYRGDGAGGFTKIRRSDGAIPRTTHTTMSIKTADLDNDLRLEIYLSQIAGRSSHVADRVRMKSWDEYCVGIERAADRAACQVNIGIRKWYPVATFRMDYAMAKNCFGLPTQDAVDQCRAVWIRDVAVRTRRPQMCRRVPADQVRTRQLCEVNARAEIDRFARREPDDGTQQMLVTGRSYPEEIPQYFGGNVLLVDRGNGDYEDRAKQAGIDVGGWSWDVKIDDFDNDGLRDVHILNGAWQPDSIVPSKLFKHNEGGMRFSDRTVEYGLEDYLIVTSAAAADFDGDGDVDEVTQTLNGPLIAYWNNSQIGRSISFDFRDEIGNSYGIGNKVTIHYGADGARRQIAELLLSGGYDSFDEPVLHFGLGDADEVSRVDVEWSTGERTTLEGPFAAEARYTIARRVPASRS